METSISEEISNPSAERIAKLEAGYEHLATKADVEKVRTDVEKLRTDVEKLRSDLTWRILLAMGALTAIFATIVRLPPSGV